MSLEIKIHGAQTIILRNLLFQPKSSYTDLRKLSDLSSDHFSFHINRLVELGLVEKISRGEYKLTVRGKEYANRLDTDNNTIERQPKSAVIFALRRIHENKEQYLFQERLKNPYYGFWGLPSGKIRWGETIVQTAEREAKEETGLIANFQIKSVYHEHVKNKSSEEIIEDKIFFMAIGDEPTGELIENFEGGHNEWLTLQEVKQKEKKYATLESEINILIDPEHWLKEQVITYTDQDF